MVETCSLENKQVLKTDYMFSDQNKSWPKCQGFVYSTINVIYFATKDGSYFYSNVFFKTVFLLRII